MCSIKIIATIDTNLWIIIKYYIPSKLLYFAVHSEATVTGSTSNSSSSQYSFSFRVAF